MSAILSADDLNDFISPGVACIKPVETLPLPSSSQPSTNPYEVTTEDNQTFDNLKAAQISLTDCLACSGCVTSAEAVLVSLQSHDEVLRALDGANADLDTESSAKQRRQVFVASISPQSRASLAAALSIPASQVKHMIDHLLLSAISQGGKRGFDYVLDTEPVLSICLDLAAKEVMDSSSSPNRSGEPRRPILTSDCPGFICYLEKTHPAVLPHVSKLKSPQAILGTLIKTLIPSAMSGDVNVYHVAVMPCFDKKLEASRRELTDSAWRTDGDDGQVAGKAGIRDVDCVITTKELLSLATVRNVNFSALPTTPMPSKPELSDHMLASLFSNPIYSPSKRPIPGIRPTGTSGGYLLHILSALQSKHEGSTIIEKRGRNADVVDYVVLAPDGTTELAKAARYYGFRNIQNLVRKLKPPKIRRLPVSASAKTAVASGKGPRRPVPASSSAAGMDYVYVEVMACPGGCTNGGGQLKPNDLGMLSITEAQDEIQVDIETSDEMSPVAAQLASKGWLAKVDEAYFSSDDGESVPSSASSSMEISNMPQHSSVDKEIDNFLNYWSTTTNISLEKLVYTTYNAVESDVGKSKDASGKGHMSTIDAAELAGKAGGGW